MPRPAAVLLTATLALATPPAIVSTTAGNAWLIVVDDLHVEFVQTGRLRTLLRAVASELIYEGDLYQLRTTGPSAAPAQPAPAFSTARDLLEQSIRMIVGNGLKLVDAVQLSVEPPPNELLTRANRALDAIERAMSAPAAAGTNRRAIVLVSSGYDVETLPQLADRISALTLRAQVEGTTIFAIAAAPPLPDPPIDATARLRYTTATRRSLTAIAEQTGGFVIEKSNEPNAELKRIAAQMR